MQDYFIVPLNDLLPGDILLMRFHDDDSQNIMELSKSSFSHATIYLGESSYAEATLDRGVIANNLQRQLFPFQDDVIVLRLRGEYFNTILIDKVIFRVRELIGTEYGVLEAVRIAEKGHQPEDGQALSPNRQTCTRLVAQAFHDAGLDIVENHAYCTPEEILKSDKLEALPVKAVQATPEEIDFANSENPILAFVEAQYQLLYEARQVTGADIQNPKQLSDYLFEHPEMDGALCEVLKKSNYLEIYKLEEELNPWHYNVDRFKSRYQGIEIRAAHGLLRSTRNQLELDRLNLYELTVTCEETHLHYFELMRDLYDNLCQQCRRRIKLAETIITDIDLIFTT